MTDDLQALPIFEIKAIEPEVAREQLGHAEAQKSAATEARDQARALVDQRREVEAEDRRAREYLRERIAALTASGRERRAIFQKEVRELRESFDAATVAQQLRTDDDTLRLYLDTHAELVEVLQGLHMLDTLEATVSLNRATASELDSMAMVSHLRTVISLEAAFKEEKKIGFIGQRTQELFGAAKEAHRLAGVSEVTLREARAAYEKQQTARVSAGIITSIQVRNAI